MEAPMVKPKPFGISQAARPYKKTGLFILKESWVNAIIGNDSKSNRGMVFIVEYKDSQIIAQCQVL